MVSNGKGKGRVTRGGRGVGSGMTGFRGLSQPGLGQRPKPQTNLTPDDTIRGAPTRSSAPANFAEKRVRVPRPTNDELGRKPS